MAYFAPYIDAAGLHIPTYNDILADMKAKVQTIFGADIYLENDSADGQLLAIFALKVNDAMQSLQLAYNSRSPSTAIAAALDSVIKLNGLHRKSPSFSTCFVTISGTRGTQVRNGVVQDINGYKWNLPSLVTIGATAVTVLAQCQTVGSITALPGDLSIIATPTAGWTSVTNSDSAVPGNPVETDSQVRARQAISTALPSDTRLNGTIAAIAALLGVTRYLVLENYTGAPETDPNGLMLPGHSITCIVEGDSDENVAGAIYHNRGIGCYTNGPNSVTIEDTNYGVETLIRFYRPEYVPIYATLNIKPLSGYTSATADSIKQAVTNYLNALQIYELVTVSGCIMAAGTVIENIARPPFAVESLLIGTAEETQSATDIPILFYQVAEGLLANVTVNEV